MAAPIQVVTLEIQQEIQLEGMLIKGRWTPREIMRARILLMANSTKQISNSTIGKTLGCSREKARRVRSRYIHNGLEAALFDRPRSGQPLKLKSEQEAGLIAIACSKCPSGTDHWTLVLLKQRLKERYRVDVSTECIRHALLRNSLKPWLKKNVVYSGSYSGI